MVNNTGFMGKVPAKRLEEAAAKNAKKESTNVVRGSSMRENNTGFMGKVPAKRLDDAKLALKKLDVASSTSAKPADINPGVDASPTNMGISMGPTTGKKTEVAPKKLNVASSTSAKPVVKKAAPTSKYRGGRSEADIQAMLNEATPDRMRASQFAQDSPDATPYKKGGAVKSGASRGDGCAERGRTRGKYC